MLRAILNRSWRQQPTRRQLYGHLPPITKTIQVRRTRHAGHCWRSRDELISDVLLWTPSHGREKAGRQHEHSFSNYVRIRDAVRKTCLRRWTIGKSGERGSGISVLPARHDDDDEVSKVDHLSRRRPKGSFSIATTQRYETGGYSFPRIAPIYPWYVPYKAKC